MCKNALRILERVCSQNVKGARAVIKGTITVAMISKGKTVRKRDIRIILLGTSFPLVP